MITCNILAGKKELFYSLIFTIPTAVLSKGFDGTFSGTCCSTFDLNGRSSGGHCKLSPGKINSKNN